MNIEKISAVVPIFGTTGQNARKHSKVTNLKDLANEGVNFDTYTIREGETLRFPKFEDIEVERVQVRAQSNSYYNIVKCESEYNGKKKYTWFGLSALYKRDVDNVPVQPSWYELGNNEARLKALCEMGEIHGERTVEIEVPLFNAEGKRVYTEVLNEDGTPVIENGAPKTVAAVKKQNVVVFSEYVPANAE